MPRALDRADLPLLAQAGATIFIGGATAEPTAILAAWREARCLDGVTLVGLQLPGFNHLSPLEFGDTCRFRTNFLAPALRPAFARGRVELMPMHHAAFYRWLATDAPVDLAVFQVSPPDAEGQCNLGPCTDLLPAMLSRPSVRLIAQINPRLPACRDGMSVHIDRLEAIYHAESALPEFRVSAGDAAPEIADHVASLVPDGATVQIGIGRLPDQVLARLAGRRNLVLHAGIVTAAALALLESGTATRIVAGLAMGDENFYRRIADAAGVAFRPVSLTHGPEGLRDIPRFIALNTALEVDLFGQANCEAEKGRLRASFGGLNDFLRTAQASPGGCSVLMLPATRIVTSIGDPSLVSVQRGDVDVVVTEHGIADLRGLGLDARAAALTAIAAPDRHDELTAHWAQRRDALA
jgi:acyl-CoA hydrolase